VPFVQRTQSVRKPDRSHWYKCPLPPRALVHRPPTRVFLPLNRHGSAVPMRRNGQVRLGVGSGLPWGSTWGSARGPSPCPEALIAKSCGDPVKENWRSTRGQTEMIVAGKFFHLDFRAQCYYRSYIGLPSHPYSASTKSSSRPVSVQNLYTNQESQVMAHSGLT
jgi:hypothetical protein